ncbi:hypothetical protein [Bdellovibrio sp. HCB274]|uniref:hypothetical protein n=1 Tax=Bdellovibrio sp. HCB274 TaxID=3394361 RepID=UPI0039B60672
MKGLKMKTALLLPFLFTTHVSASPPDDANICRKEAVQAVSKKLSVPKNQIHVLGAAMIGDGSFVSRIFMISVLRPGQEGPEGYVVRFNTDSADYCDVTSADAKIENY